MRIHRGLSTCARIGILATVLTAAPGEAAAQSTDDEPTTGIEWPSEGSVSAVFAVLPDGAIGSAPALAWPAADADPSSWAYGGPWRHWAQAVLWERDGHVSRAESRELLSLTAQRQGRHSDAWRHAAAAARLEPDRGRALLARLLPGAPAGTKVLGDGRLEPLPAGVLLEPSIAPPTDPGPDRYDVREVVLHGLRIGEGAVSLKIGVRGDGVELRVEHESGGPVEFSVRVPCPLGFRTRVEYAEWEKLPTIGEAIPVRVEAGGEAFRIWARNELDSTPWPATTPTALDARLRDAGMLLVIDPGDPRAPELAALAAAYAQVLGVPCRTATDPTNSPAGTTAPLRVDLRGAAGRPSRLAALTGAVERFALGPSPAGR